MAENKEITTLHPYMNRNKNRYPNVKEENIPDTIQRKLTAGTGINISPENVISATGGDSYTRSETDALLDTKADKVALENVNKVVPTDIAVKDGKLGLEHDTTWLTNQNAITLGDGLTYDEATKTLKAEGSGATLPTGKSDDPFKIGSVKVYSEITEQINFKYLNDLYGYITFGRKGLQIISRSNESGGNIKLSTRGGYNKYGAEIIISGINFTTTPDAKFYINNDNKANDIMYIPALERPSTDGKYNLQITKTGSSYHYDWVVGGGYNHYIVITDDTASNAIYLLIPSTNNLICNILTDLDTLLGTEPRFIQASGVVTDTASKLPIVAIKWQGSFSSSKIVTISSEEATTKFTDIVDVVEPA